MLLVVPVVYEIIGGWQERREAGGAGGEERAGHGGGGLNVRRAWARWSECSALRATSTRTGRVCPSCAGPTRIPFVAALAIKECNNNEKGSTPMTDQDARDVLDRSKLIRDFDEVLDRVIRLLRQISTRELGETYGLSRLQMHALATLGRTGQELEMRSIAASTGLPASSVTSIVNRLVKLELVERRHSDVDRRRVVARITPAGEEVMTRIDAWSMQLFEQMLSQSATEDLVTCITVFAAVGEWAHDIVEANRLRERS